MRSLKVSRVGDKTRAGDPHRHGEATVPQRRKLLANFTSRGAAVRAQVANSLMTILGAPQRLVLGIVDQEDLPKGDRRRTRARKEEQQQEREEVLPGSPVQL
jgi:hypothetical protein